MMQITVSTCGTSIFTNGTGGDDVKFLRENANKNEAEYTPKELERIERIIGEKRGKLSSASPKEVQALSAELNGFISFYGNGAELSEAKQNIHYLIHTDTYQGRKAAELIQAWGSANNINMQTVLIDDLNTGSIEEFRLGVNNLVEWCAWTLPGYRSQGYRVIFNLVGGFKSLQGYMQTLGMFYADETVYIFETGGELLRIPKMPVDFSANAKKAVLDNFNAFRLMQRESIPRSECSGIPETLLDIIDGKCGISAWGHIIWEEVQHEVYSKEVLPPLSGKVIISVKAKEKAETFSPDRITRFNQAVDKLSRYIDTGRKESLNTCALRQLKSNPVPPSTHEFNLWPDMGGWRGFCHYDENNNLIIDDMDMGLGHR
ncbi:MAG: CRISPR-associated protein [Synergistaceae bacterium]|nr:CRISPR-associated protein [Synergistaceae bacterium]MBQ6982778.1 CRISPR-associated protein [Synergistaceae bacterium]